MEKEKEESGSDATDAKLEESVKEQDDDDKAENETILTKRRNSMKDSASSGKRGESMCVESSTQKASECGTGVDEAKTGEEDETTFGKPEWGSEPKVAGQPPNTEHEEPDSVKTKGTDEDNPDEERVELQGLRSSVCKVWGRESFSPVGEVWGEDGLKKRDDDDDDDEEEEEEEEEQEEDKAEVENQSEEGVLENQGRSVGKRNLQR